MMRVQMFADYFVIERGSEINPSYFVLFVSNKPSWTNRIAKAARFSDSTKAEETIQLIKARELFRKGICSSCKQGHKEQIERYPKGARIVAIAEIGNGGVAEPLPFGSTGRVAGHCDDGRAWITFDADDSAHTFHFPEQNIAVEFKPKRKMR